MAGYAATWQLNAAGPWGTVAWLVIGTGVTVAGAIAVDKVRDQTKSETKTKTIAETKSCEDCNKKRYTVRVHAQGSDLPGGTPQSTVGAPAITQTTPVTVAQGMALSTVTKGLLQRRQLAIRVGVIAQAEAYIEGGPAAGGRLGTKSFVVRGVRGGVRYDVDCFGDGRSFVS